MEILVEARGAATRTLSALPEGTEVAVSGPLGRPFNDHPKDAAALLIAGGIGVAGLRLLASELLADGTPVIALIGATTADRLLDGTLPHPTESEDFRIELATDDGTAGHEGTVCDLLRSHEEHLPEACHAYICGPRAMIDSAGGMALDMGLGASALLEETMACGVGACRGCVVATRNGYRSVCGEGPVFDVRDLLPERDDDA